MKLKLVRKKNINKETANSHPIEVGETFITEFPEANFKVPTVGECFNQSFGVITTPVTEIVSVTCFRTKNSEYHWKILSL
jgi:hypothetical protein